MGAQDLWRQVILQAIKDLSERELAEEAENFLAGRTGCLEHICMACNVDYQTILDMYGSGQLKELLKESE